jgi:hypothetical protein
MSSFTRDLRALLRAPYSIIQIETHEEARCVELLHRLAAADHRPVWEWSPTRGFNGQEKDANLLDAFDAIAQSEAMGIFIFKDAAPMLEDMVLRRRLRELEPICARSHKTPSHHTPRAPEGDHAQGHAAARARCHSHRVRGILWQG